MEKIDKNIVKNTRNEDAFRRVVSLGMFRVQPNVPASRGKRERCIFYYFEKIERSRPIRRLN